MYKYEVDIVFLLINGSSLMASKTPLRFVWFPLSDLSLSSSYLKPRDATLYQSADNPIPLSLALRYIRPHLQTLVPLVNISYLRLSAVFPLFITTSVRWTCTVKTSMAT